jgi:ATP-dependent Lhr-like helicase
MLLRLARRESIPSFEPLGIERLPLFLAVYQGVINPKDNIDGLYDCIEQLLCYPAEAAAWESEVLPARLHPYDPSWLDTLMQEGGLLWLGSEGHRVAFCLESDLDLLKEDSEEKIDTSPNDTDSTKSGDRTSVPSTDLFKDPGGRYDFLALLRASGSDDVGLAKRLWGKGGARVTNDTLPCGCVSGFKLSDTAIRDEKITSSHKTQETWEKGSPIHLLTTLPGSNAELRTIHEAENRRMRPAARPVRVLFRSLQRFILRWSAFFRICGCGLSGR